MFHYIIALFFFISSAITAQESIRFQMNQRWISLTSTWDVIDSEGLNVGRVDRAFISLLPEYHYYDPVNIELAYACMRFFALGAQFDFYTADHVHFGAVEEYLLTWFPTFDIKSTDEQVLAHARMNFWGTKWIFYQPETGEEIALMARPFFRLKDDWTIHILNPRYFRESGFNLMFFYLLGAFESDREHWRKRHTESAAFANEVSVEPQKELTVGFSEECAERMIQVMDSYLQESDSLEQILEKCNVVLKDGAFSHEEKAVLRQMLYHKLNL